MKTKREFKVVCESEKDERMLRVAWELTDHVASSKLVAVLNEYGIDHEEFDAFWTKITDGIDNRHEY